MSLVYFLQVLNRNPFFSLSASFLNSVQTDLRSTAQVDNGFQGTILSHLRAKLAINSVLSLIQIPLAVHDLSEHLPVRQRRSFREVNLLRLFPNRFIPKKIPRVQGVELESEGPAFGIFIIILEQVTTDHVLPFLHRFLDDCEVE
jgi:hypothetical protein